MSRSFFFLVVSFIIVIFFVELGLVHANVCTILVEASRVTNSICIYASVSLSLCFSVLLHFAVVVVVVS